METFKSAIFGNAEMILVGCGSTAEEDASAYKPSIRVEDWESENMISLLPNAEFIEEI